ncbi:MAG TPA: dienelactone hydrolase family protein, partial [Thermoplasmata archaeon]
MPRDDDELLSDPTLSFGSGVVGVCDVCGHRQAVIILQKERFKLCVLDFLNKTWLKPGLTPMAPLPPYRSERVWFSTDAVAARKAPAILLSPTKAVRRPVALVTPDIYGLTTSVLDAGIRLAREGFEVLLPDVGKTSGIGPGDHLSLRVGARFRGGVPLDGARVIHLRQLYSDALRYLRGREMVDGEKTAVLGISYGASLALALATQDRSVGALVVAYPVPVRPPEYLKLVTAPVLFVDAGRDAQSRRARAQFEL